LFLNGIYWGTYDPTEQENAGFSAAYYGGSKDDYDVVEQGGLKGGSLTAYNAMVAIPSPIDNTKYEQMKGYLDIPQFIDYMLLHFWVGHQDWGDDINKNWYAARNFKTNGTFKYFPWDMENLMWDQTVDRTTVASPASGLHPKLVTNAQYLLDFADRVQKHMVSPDGALLSAAATARWNKWQSVLTNAIACESARWGDYRRDVHQNSAGPYVLYTWNGTFITEVNRLKNTYFPNRVTGQVSPTQGVLPQLRSRGLYPMLNAPEFRDNSNNALVSSQRVPAGFQLKMQFPTGTSFNTSGTLTTNAGTFYYTTDGADPRVYYDTTGAKTPTAVAYASPIPINTTTTVKARTLNGTAWSALMEATFTVGPTQPPVRITEIHYNPPANQGGASAEFIEIQNTGTKAVDIGNWSFDGVDLVIPAGTILGAGDRMVFASNNSPATFAAQFPGVTVGAYFGGSLDNGGERLALIDATGRTIVSVDYDDVAPWPITPDGGGYSLEIIDPNGDPDSPANWKASNAVKGTPGAANSAPAVPAVTISEFLAVNTGAYSFGGQNPGYVEFYNSSASPVDLSNYQLTVNGGTSSLPPGTSIDAGTYLLVHYHPVTVPDLWVQGSIDDQQGDIRLANAAGVFMDGVRYGPQAANYSFSRIGGAWTLSNPTPGAANTAATVGAQTTLRLNEWLANPAPGADDWLEITNPGAAPVALTGMFVGTSTQLFRISAPAAVAAGGYVQYLGNRGGSHGNNLDFQIPAAGTTLSLYDSTGTLADSQIYTAQTEGVSRGRLPNATGAATALPYPSPRFANYAAISGPQINEVLVTNLNGDNAPWARRSPWVELKNPTGGAVSLAGWQLRSTSLGSAWTIPAGVTISAGGYLPIWADQAQPASTVNGPHLNFAFTPPTDPSLVDGLELVNALGADRGSDYVGQTNPRSQHRPSQRRDVGASQRADARHAQQPARRSRAGFGVADQRVVFRRGHTRQRIRLRRTLQYECTARGPRGTVPERRPE
jgi:hypothetical protein